MGGDYRNILVKPYDMKYQLIDYSDKTRDLVQSDWDRMQENLSTVEGDEKKQNPEEAKGEKAAGEPTDVYKALVVEYSLPSSAYATMALRELLLDEPLTA